DNWQVIGFDVNDKVRKNATQEKIEVAVTLDSLLDKLEQKKIIFLSTPAGKITNQLIEELSFKLNAGDIIIDSGNSNYHDSVKNYELLQEKQIDFLDCGTSGGMAGARYGACLMIGGEKKVFEFMEPFFKSLACKDGYIYSGSAGSGHYLKMVHNGIEYGMMQAMGEGFDILQSSDYEFDSKSVAQVWNHGSVIRSWLMELLAQGLVTDPDLAQIKGKVDASGEAKWTIEEALRLNVPIPVIASSLFARNASQIEDSFSNKVVATLRQGFGGHKTFKKE